MWFPEGPDLDPDPYRDYEHIEDLIYYDGPLSYVVRLTDGTLRIFHWLDIEWNEERTRLARETFLVVPIDEATIEEAKAGRIGYRAVLTRPGGVVEEWMGNGSVRYRAVPPEGVPDDQLPDPDATL